MSEQNQEVENVEVPVENERDERRDELRDAKRKEADEKNSAVSVGTKDTKEGLKLVYAILKVLKEAKQNDGQISSADLALLPQLFPYIGPALDNAANIKTELGDLDPAEVKDLLVFSSVQVSNVVSEVNEELVEKSLKAAIALVDLVSHLTVEDK